MEAAIIALWIALLFLAYVVAATQLILRAKARRQVRPPIELKLLRLPGETSRLKADALFEQMMEQLLFGAGAATILMMAPFLVVPWVPKVEGWPLLLSSGSLFIAASIYYLRKVVKIGMERASYRLGSAGEREVAGHLQALNAKGYWVFHDVPVEREGGVENIDHLAVGPNGLVVIETKARSIATNEKSGSRKVTFDGERLIWPKWSDDRKTVQQVKRCAKWVADLARGECGREIPVHTIIAIPGWEVQPGNFYNPRVLHPGALGHAFEMMMMDQATVLKPAEIKRLAARIEQHCRVSDW